MDQRERLIELLSIAVGDSNLTDSEVKIVADHLLANGVVVPPVSVGEVVCVIEPCTCYNDYSERCHHRRTKATKYIAIVQLPKKHHKKCLKLFERPFKIEYLNKLGKTVFLTREEAEREIERRKQ